MSGAELAARRTAAAAGLADYLGSAGTADPDALEALTADVADLRRKAAEQEEQLRALGEQVAGLSAMLTLAFGHAGVSCPLPRHLRAVPSFAQGSLR
jgi:hypothetical protein